MPSMFLPRLSASDPDREQTCRGMLPSVAEGRLGLLLVLLGLGVACQSLPAQIKDAAERKRVEEVHRLGLYWLTPLRVKEGDPRFVQTLRYVAEAAFARAQADDTVDDYRLFRERFSGFPSVNTLVKESLGLEAQAYQRDRLTSATGLANFEDYRKIYPAHPLSTQLRERERVSLTRPSMQSEG